MSDLTRAQKQAVETLDGNVAVSAGAGSGKTRVLAHRFAYALRNGGPDRPAIDEILTITFTSKAAAEIAERVRRVLAQQGEHDLARRIDEAWISTIHGLCSRLVKRHALETGVSPAFTTADETRSALLRNEVWERTAPRLLAEDEDVARLFDAMSNAYLRKTVWRVYDQLRSMGASARDVEPAFGSLDAEMAASAPVFDELADALESAPPTAVRVASAQALRRYASRLRAGDGTAARELSEGPKPWRNDTKNGVDGTEAQERIAVMSACLLEADCRWVPEAFVRLLQACDEEYRSIKLTAEVLDFDDLQEHAAALLRDDSVAEAYRGRFGLVMVDEFQDTNALQMQVIERLSDANLCIVGDDKQSIYGWRYADVRVFEQARERADEHIELDTNFRSHKHIVQFTNELFSRAPFWRDHMRLHAGADPSTVPWPEEGPRVELMRIDSGDARVSEAARMEGAAVADRVAELLGLGVDTGDIVVLLRSSTYAAMFASALEQRGIAATCTAGGSFFNAEEIQDLRALLRAIALPDDDAALARVLAGALTGLSPAGLWRVRAHTPAGAALWEGVRALCEAGVSALSPQDETALRSTRDLLDTLRTQAGRESLSAVLRAAVAGFDYDLVLLARKRSGETAWANVQKLIRLAGAYERAEAPDVLGFERYLELRERYAVHEEEGATAVSGRGAVRIMTVHSAKGLEFPIVIVPDLGRGLTLGTDAPFVLGDARETGVPLGFKMPGDDGKLSVSSVQRTRILREHEAREIAEEKRVFYVACTRAAEALILAGTTGSEGSRLSWVSDSLTQEQGSDVFRLGEARIRVRDIDGPDALACAERAVASTETNGQSPPDRRTEQDRVEAGQLERASTVLQRCADGSAESSEGRVLTPDRVSYSSLSEYKACPMRFYMRHRLGLRTERIGDSTRATRLGSAVHAVLARAGEPQPEDRDFAAVSAMFGLEGEARQRLRAAVDTFLGSALAREVAECERIAREQPFSVPLGETRLEGSIDLIGWRGTDALIVDYKSGTADLSREGLESYRNQAECYALAAIAAGARRVRAMFIRLERDGELYEFEFAAPDAERIRAALRHTLSAMAQGHYAPLETYRHDTCDECPALYGLCPTRPAARQGGSSA